MPRGIPKDPSEQRKILHKLKIVRGHLDKVIGMVAEEKYCIDVIHQTLAIQQALKRIDEEILSRHLTYCVSQALSKEEKDKQLKEILEVFKKGRK